MIQMKSNGETMGKRVIENNSQNAFSETDQSIMSNSILLILNPVSGQLDYEKSKEKIVAYLDQIGRTYEIRETQGEGDAFRWTKEAVGFDLVIVGGGDGTIMEGLSGMIKNRKPIPLAQLPMGTANLLARSLAIPTKLENALDLALEQGLVAKLDVGYLPEYDRYFAIVAGSGWDANMIQDADREMKNKLGFFAYIVSGFRHLFDLRRSRVRIKADEKEYLFLAHTVMVINIGEIYGTGLAIGKSVSPHDGKLDLAVAMSHTAWGFIKLLFRILFGRFTGSPDLKYLSASHLKVEAHPPLKLEIDGEPIGETPFEVEVVPNGAHLVVSRDYIEAKELPAVPVFRE